MSVTKSTCFLAFTFCLLGGCSVLSGGGAGASKETAIVIVGAQSSLDGVPREYAWIKEHFPGWKVVIQGLEEYGDKSYDVVTIKSGDGGETRDIYFDITDLRQKNKSFIDKLRDARQL